MHPAQNPIEIYQLRVVLRETSPPIWRRFLVRSDSSIVDLHQTIQMALGWSGRRAFAFEVQGHRWGVRFEGDAREMLLADFRLYVTERFTYTYNAAEQEGRPWRFEIRLEQKLAMDIRQHYPRCIGGGGGPPPQPCGGALSFFSPPGLFSPPPLARAAGEKHGRALGAGQEGGLRHLQRWIHRKLDRRAINQQLRQVGKDIRKERPQP